MKKLSKHNPTLRKKLKKDPGIPNLFPFKKEILEEIEKSEELNKEKKQKKKEQKEIEKEKKTLGTDMHKLALDARKKEAEFETKQNLMGDEKVDDGVKELKQDSLSKSSKQYYYQEFKQVVEKSDVILFVLDARDPLGCRCPDIEKTIISQNSRIKLVFVLNKIDLVPREVLQKWLAYLRKEHPTIAFKASTQQQKKLSRSKDVGPAESAPYLSLKSDSCLGADSLIKLMKNYSRSEDIKRTITVGIIGYPNVGKSSIINSLKRVKSAKVGATPGVTKQSQEFQLDKHIKLLDCPGIIFSSSQLDSDVILRNAIRIEKLDDPITPALSIVERCRKEQLKGRYDISEYKDATDFLVQLAKLRGKLMKGNQPNLKEISKMILRDWNTGKIPFFTLPPRDENEDIKNLDIDLEMDDSVLDSDQILSLKEAFQKDFVPMVSSKPQEFREVKEDSEDLDFEDQEDEDESDDDEILED